MVSTRVRAGEDIVLAVDANEPLRESEGRMRAFLTSTGLVDVMAKHGAPPRTCLRGPHRIDFIFVTPALVALIRKSGQLGVHDAIPSDHVEVWIEFDNGKLFKSSTESLGSTNNAPFTAHEMSKMEK